MNALLSRARREHAEEGLVSLDTAMALAAEGFDLDALDATLTS